MIILGEALEVSVAKATSTYPAVIINVENITDNTQITINLVFYCPSTMPGQPSDALLAAVTNIVTAPIRPHDGADVYNFRQGDIIIISFADGNLNSPQFVRFMQVSDSIRAINVSYIQGNPVLPEAFIALDDNSVTLDADILKASVNLLPAVRLCAKGVDNSENVYILDNGINNPFVKDMVYRKCGRYGVELFTNDVPVSLSDYSPLTTMYNDSRYNAQISFLDICRYFYNQVTEPNYKTIIDVFTEAYKITSNYDNKVIPKGEKEALDIYQALAGLDDWDNGAPIINQSVYNEDDKEEPEILKINSHIHNFYFTNPFTNEKSKQDVIDFQNKFWKEFDVKYKDQMDRAYAIILFNNVWRLKQKYGNSQTVTPTIIIMAVIATAFTLLEATILGENTLQNTDYKQFLDDTFNDITTITSFKDFDNTKFILNIVGMYFDVLDYSRTDMLDIYYDLQQNVKTMINYLIANEEAIINNYTSQINPLVPEGVTSSDFLWPTPNLSHISSPFGWRNALYSNGVLVSAAKNHNGIDIAGSGALNSPIVATKPGTVIKAVHADYGGYGKYLIIQHDNGYTSLYGHCNSVNVNVNDVVQQGQNIAVVGSTGASTGAHLHFEIRKNNIAVDPMTLVVNG